MSSYAKIRKVFKLTQVEMAKLMSVTAQTISNWEKGRAVPSSFDAAVYRRLSQLAAMPGHVPAVAQELSEISTYTTRYVPDHVLNVIFTRYCARPSK